jgi:hypothetical protein
MEQVAKELIMKVTRITRSPDFGAAGPGPCATMELDNGQRVSCTTSQVLVSRGSRTFISKIKPPLAPWTDEVLRDLAQQAVQEYEAVRQKLRLP